jgi:hypothetical protein
MKPTSREETKVETQIKIVKDHLERCGKITGKQAFDEYEIYRLSSIIDRLRHKKRVRIKTYMKWNEKKTSRFAEYQLIKR